jgi:uncharacterized protein
MMYTKYFMLIAIFFSLMGKVKAQTMKKDTTDIVVAKEKDETWQNLPKPIGFTSDFAHLFTNNQIKYLNKKIAVYENKTSIEIAIVTMDSNSITKENFNDFATQLLNKWGIGKKIKNNGMLILVSPHLRNIRISNGYGIEAVLTDKETKSIIDKYFIPFFAKNEYYKGVLNGLDKIFQTLNEKFKIQK